ncbi:helix-turn-helix transcriptional regulator [Paenibacillus sp. IB182496]|uniref:Helix-turn-helix transcriptional regulator n=1 Tax=Paenibacillus sabuli TaxID=2772509 RepID=A0A927BT88_9BACL|nr:AraC family transcriptional regulator [Paenibacillus sabuli]MBD2845345.1 helix-turn-helix transcriptional regulator [Paenibacillus sabuli]
MNESTRQLNTRLRAWMEEAPGRTPDRSYFAVPEELGVGGCRRIDMSDGVQLHLNTMCLNQSLCLEGRTRGPVWMLACCMAESIQWTQEGSGRLHRIGTGECKLYPLQDMTERSLFEAGIRYTGASLTIRPERLAAYGAPELDPSRLQPHSFGMTADMRLILEQVAGCAMTGRLREMYLEAKLSEMLALSLAGPGRAVAGHGARGELSRTDLARLQEARDILDARFAAPPGLAELARSVQLNEYKLKRGFKQVFGKPVYAYVLDKRMMAARRMLEVEGVTVREAAERVGYANSQHFSRAFQRAFHCNPSSLRTERIIGLR